MKIFPAEDFEKIDDLVVFGPGNGFLRRFGDQQAKNSPKICLGGDFLGQNNIFNVWTFFAVRDSHFPNSHVAVAERGPRGPKKQKNEKISVENSPKIHQQLAKKVICWQKITTFYSKHLFCL